MMSLVRKGESLSLNLDWSVCFLGLGTEGRDDHIRAVLVNCGLVGGVQESASPITDPNHETHFKPLLHHPLVSSLNCLLWLLYIVK